MFHCLVLEYSYRQQSNGGDEPANAKPCAICEELIRLSGIKVVEYTTG